MAVPKGRPDSLPRRHAAPGSKPLTVYGWRGKGHLPALLRRSLELVEHAAVGVVDQHDLPGAEQPLADGQRPDLVVGDDPAGVADHVGLAVAEAEQPVDVEAGVHACDDGKVRGRRHRQRAAEALRIAGVVGQVLVDSSHGAPARRWARAPAGAGITILTRFVLIYLFCLLIYKA